MISRRIVDLTFPIHEGMTTFPTYWHPTVEVSLLGQHETENRETRKLVLGTHTGTHCDAPRHFIAGAKSVDMLSLDILIGPAFVIDFSITLPGQEINMVDFEKKLGDRYPQRLLMRFDWSDYWGKTEYYINHPFISLTAARWLMERGVRLLGMDTPTPDNPKHGRGSELDSPVHKILLNNDVILVEYLCNLKELQKQEVELICLPLKILGGDGSPVRCIAIES